MQPVVTWDHVHLRSPDPEATATWLQDVLGGVIIRSPGRIDVKLGGADVFIAPVAAGDGVNAPPVTPYQGLDHFGLTVKDIDAVAAGIKAKGIGGPNPVGIGVSGTFTDTAAVMNGTALVGKASQIFAATLRKLADTD